MSKLPYCIFRVKRLDKKIDITLQIRERLTALEVKVGLDRK
ncbi:MAG: hypothetical protein ACP5JP_10455 [bacterium]